METISAESCERLLHLDDVLAQVRRALEWERAGAITWPTPRNLNIVPDRSGNHYHVKACVLEELPVAGIRMVSHPGDDDSGGGTRLILLVDPATTEPLALVDESWNYSQRTVASVVLASAAVALADATTLALVGSGNLARTALAYYLRLVPGLRELRVTSRTPERREAFAAWAAAEHALTATAFASAEEAVRGAQLILTCTSAQRPLLADSWVESGAVVAALDTVELEPELALNADLLVVDSREQLARELAECYGASAPERVDATFAELLGGAHPGRTGPGQRVVIVSQGLASQDVALAYLAWQRACARDGHRAAPAAT
jgi:ornithine cyclodeaminase/alanine dehydrogenase-like protein (mu-crystallin family)